MRCYQGEPSRHPSWIEVAQRPLSRTLHCGCGAADPPRRRGSALVELALDLPLELARLALRVRASLLGGVLDIAQCLAQVFPGEVVEVALELLRLLADVLARLLDLIAGVVLTACRERHGQRRRSEESDDPAA